MAAGRPAGHPAAAAGLPDQPRRPVLQGLERGRPARPPAAPAQPAGPRRSPATAPARSARPPGTRRSDASSPAIRRSPAALRARRVGCFGGGGLTNEKAYAFGKFARVALRTAHDRLQRPVLHVVRGHRGQPRLRDRSRAAVPARRHRRGRGDPAGRLEPRRHHAAGHAVLRRGPRRRGARHIVVDPRRTATAAGADPASRSRCPGTDLALANGLLHLAIHEGLVDDEYVDAADEGVRRGPAGGRLLLAGPGRTDHRRPRRRPRADVARARRRADAR